MNILATGLSGMVGTTLAKLLDGQFEFHDFSLESHADIRDRNQVFETVKNFSGDYILHLAAKTDVDACEEDKNQDSRTQRFKESKIPAIIGSYFIDSINWEKWSDKNTAFAINVVGTKNIAESSLKYGKKLIYISTDFVFDGRSTEPYTEESVPHPINYYGSTKYWGELVVQHICPEALIIRITFPFGAAHADKLDFIAQIRKRLESKQTVNGITDNSITPTYIEDIARALQLLIEKKETGIFHVVGNSSLSSHEIALAIAQNFDYDRHLVSEVLFNDYYKDRAPRPQFLKTSNRKIQKTGYTPRTLPDALRLV